MAGRAIVVGGGVIGMATADALSRDGWRVSVVDRGEIGHGCSRANAGLIVPSHSHPLPGPGVVLQALRWMRRKDSPFYIRPLQVASLLGWLRQFRRHCNAVAAERGTRALCKLSRPSIELFERQSAELDFDFERRGLLHACVTQKGVRKARAEAAELEEAGFKVRLLTKPEALDLEPALGPEIYGGLMIEGDAHGSCLGYVEALFRVLETRGVALITGHEVTGILTRDSAVGGVRFDDGREVETDVVVLAAGVWSGGLARTVGLEIPLQPAKGYSCTFDTYTEAPKIPIFVPETRVFVTPIGDRVRLAGTLELAGFDERIDSARYSAVLRSGLHVLREVPELTHEVEWSGLRPLTPDGLPVIGAAPGVDGLFVATGHAMLGFTQAPITGQVIADLAGGREPSAPIDAFRPDRFV